MKPLKTSKKLISVGGAIKRPSRTTRKIRYGRHLPGPKGPPGGGRAPYFYRKGCQTSMTGAQPDRASPGARHGGGPRAINRVRGTPVQSEGCPVYSCHFCHFQTPKSQHTVVFARGAGARPATLTRAAPGRHSNHEGMTAPTRLPGNMPKTHAFWPVSEGAGRKCRK